MLGMDWIRATLALLALAYFLRKLLSKNKSKTLPPGPVSLPIVGNIHLLGKNPHQDLSKLAKKYGPIMYMRLGFYPYIIVSSPHAAEQFLKTYDHVFAGRPPHEAAKYLSYGQKNLVSSQYGPFWRNIRKVVTVELLSHLKIASFQPMRREELGLLVQSIKKAGSDKLALNLSAKIQSLSVNMSCRMVFGKKFDDLDESGFVKVLRESMILGVAPNLGDYYPYLGVLDLQGISSRFKAMAKFFDEYFENVINEHVEQANKGHSKDFVYTLIEFMESNNEAEFRFDRRNIKALMMDLLAASTETTGTSIEWVMSELLKHPKVLQKVKQEIEKVVGKDRMVEEADLEKFEYLDIVIKESFRLHPAAPLLIPHEALEDCTVDGFFIPKKSRIMINAWTIGRDPDVWTDPDKFIPERFIGKDIDIRGRDFRILPFGAGRRGCAGTQLGLTTVRLVVAQLAHCFDWELPNGMLPEDLDMIEEFGAAVARKNHLLAIPTYRLHK